MIIGARTGAWAGSGGGGGGDKPSSLPWIDWAICGFDTWHANGALLWTRGDHANGWVTPSAGNPSRAGYSCNGTHRMIWSEFSFAPPICWRFYAEATFAASTTDRVIADGAIRYTNYRGACLGIESSGRWLRVSKLNGNGSGLTFEPDESAVLFDPTATLTGRFEIGVIPHNGGYATYRAFNDEFQYFGATLPASSFATGNFYEFAIGSSATSGYGSIVGNVTNFGYQYLEVN